jgi:hypothetical protein
MQQHDTRNTLFLEPISKSPEQDNEAGELDGLARHSQDGFAFLTHQFHSQLFGIYRREEDNGGAKTATKISPTWSKLLRQLPRLAQAILS